MKKAYLLLLILASLQGLSQTVTISVDPTQGKTHISPWIYGRNNNTSDDPSNPMTAAQWNFYNDAGLRMYRENGGNNSTKYNWRLKLSSHPDWYNNVYDHDWDYSMNSILSNTSNTQALFAFQLLGKAASNAAHNFDDYHYNNSQWWSGTGNNWAGGGGPAPYGNGGNGNPNLYLENWTADSTVGILTHWNNLGYDASRYQYWNMDNEPEIWQYTHDDIASSSITAEMYMQKYFAVAKAARLKYPGIKLCGPVSPSEWQWYSWNNSKITYKGADYPWMEYFIMRIGEEQKATGIRLLDVLDIHCYPNNPSNDVMLQLHRLWFDTQWNYPDANGVKVVGPYSWNSGVTKEYFFGRCNQWLTQHIGASHGVKFSISEYGSLVSNGSEDPNVIACWYASHLGTFADKGIEFFTPWDWYKGQWEVMHLFSNYYGTLAVKTVNSTDTLVNAYSSISADEDSVMIVVVNKDQVNARSVNLNLQNFVPTASVVNGYQLSGLSGETFFSKSNNALQTKTFTIAANQLSFSAPKLSVTMIQIPKQGITTGIGLNGVTKSFAIYPNPTRNKLTINVDNPDDYTVNLQDITGRQLASWNMSGNGQIDLSSFEAGTYLIQIIQNSQVITRKIIRE
ncbi:MAG: glycoside hydrolase family 44 protein [Cytophagaceae bacterium]